MKERKMSQTYRSEMKESPEKGRDKEKEERREEKEI